MNRAMLNHSRVALAMLIGLTCTVLLLGGCNRGQPSSEPPVHLVPNMDNQPRYETQGPGPFFDDGMAMRQPVEGTIARGQLITDAVYHTGRDARGNLVATSPVTISMALLQRGQQRFDIYCSSCHGRTGNGQGLVVKKGMIPPPSFHEDRLRRIEDGHLFDIMTNGKGNMASYRYQVPAADRWAIISYIRALQRSHNATIDDLPADTSHAK